MWPGLALFASGLSRLLAATMDEKSDAVREDCAAGFRRTQDTA